MAAFFDRVTGAMALRAATFEDVEHDPGATPQAAAVVILASVSSALAFVPFGGGIAGVATNAVWALVTWAFFAGLMWVVGTKIMPGTNTEADFGQLLRTMGFAQAPGLVAWAGLIPFAGGMVWLGVVAWAVAATVVAVRQALDYDSTGRAVTAVLVALVAAAVLTASFALLSGLRAVVVS